MCETGFPELGCSNSMLDYFTHFHYSLDFRLIQGTSNFCKKEGNMNAAVKLPANNQVSQDSFWSSVKSNIIIYNTKFLKFFINSDLYEISAKWQPLVQASMCFGNVHYVNELATAWGRASAASGYIHLWIVVKMTQWCDLEVNNTCIFMHIF